MSTHVLPNDVWANFIQIPVIIVSLLIPAAIKRRFCDRAERITSAWAADFWRLLTTNCVSLAMLVTIALNFEGNDCVNFYTVVTIDMCLGIFIEMSIVSLMIADNYSLGFYGPHPGIFRVKARQTLLACINAVCCRCVSGITAVALFPLVNGTLHSHDDLMWGHGWAFTAIATPSIYHLTRLMCFDSARPNRRIRPVGSVPLAESSAFSITGPSDEEDDRNNTENTDEDASKTGSRKFAITSPHSDGEETAF